ncbi:hypothetical protein [Paenibacillus lutrae]|uniref:Uncharacterized protein n=1 Tax=Paenibacillus lutrae TaxID=2078573 RepID=A0A7X3FLS2_9BACL|nr:hypothetical protein [Paenibacillus lutrae]MVP01819.1 hypothetical protein [Paenibacillus lutrae]
MREDWKERYEETLGKESELDHLNRRLTKVISELEHAKRNRIAAEAILAEESRDVQQLENPSFRNMWYTILGRKEQKLEEEEAEALQARIRLEETSTAEEQLTYEKEQLDIAIANTRSWEQEAVQLLREKEDWLREQDPEIRSELNDLYARRKTVLNESKELAEAVTAGRRVIDSLTEAQELLKSAKNWGTYDMLGGGMIATHIKRSRADEAKNKIEAAQSNMRKFKRELEDVGRHSDMNLDYGGFLGFADYFMDGFVFDWIVQGRISTLQEKVQQTLTHLKPLLAELQKNQQAAVGEEAQLSRRISALIQHA